MVLSKKKKKKKTSSWSESGTRNSKSDDGSAKSVPNSPFASSTAGSPPSDFFDSVIRKTSGEDSPPCNQDDVLETQRYGF
jgi:epidermal growth factor receptor substrate 15